MTILTTTIGSRRILPHLRRRILGISSSASSSLEFSTSTPSPSPSSWVTTEVLEDDKRIALLKLHRAPANALSLEMCQEISAAIRNLEEEHSTTAVVLSSALPSKIFSAGLDISTELYKPNLDRLPEFWKSFQQLFLDLYGSKDLTTIAAIEGPAPAGGCMLALSCDYRLMDASPKNRSNIGLNESHLGIVAPPWMCQQYIDALGHRKAELALLSGILFPPEQALKIGLVDELVRADDNGDDNLEAAGGRSSVEDAAISKAKEFVRIPQGARAAVKQLTRGPLVDKLERDREKDVDVFCEFVTSDNVQVAIGRYLEAMVASKASKKKK
jgi:3,2-trans-enoyl-CoA isomerase